MQKGIALNKTIRKESKMKVVLNLAIVVLIVLGFSSDVKAEIFKKAQPAESTGFTVDEMMDKPEDLPFHKVWKRAGVSLDDYDEIYIVPVNTAYLKENGWWKDLGLKDVEKDIDTIASFAWDTMVESFRNDPNHRFKVVSAPGPKTLIMEMAITELVPNKAGFEAALTAASMGVGALAVSAGSAAGKSFGSKSSVAFEMRLRDSGTDKVVGMVADREEEQASPINIKNFTWYGHAESIIKSWADQFVKIANRGPGEVVSDTPAFTFKPW
jgi:hypothetical protein